MSVELNYINFASEFQIHVIKPVLPKLNSLYEYAISEKGKVIAFRHYFNLMVKYQYMGIFLSKLSFEW